MALSNWDTLSFDHLGNPNDGSLKGFHGEAEVEIYKNWIYVRCKSMYANNYGFVKPVISSISHGDITLAGFRIIAKRHHAQQSIFMFAHCVNHETNKERWMAGIGSSGYDDPTPKMAKALKIDLKDYSDIYYTISSDFNNRPGYITLHGTNNKTRKQIARKLPDIEKYRPRYTGVQLETYNEFLKWLEEEVIEENYSYKADMRDWFEKISDPSRVKRFNQGNMFFAANVGTDLGATGFNKTEEPLLNKIIKSSSE